MTNIDYAEPRIIMTGVTGFVGAHLVYTMLKAGESVLGLARDRGNVSAEQRAVQALSGAAGCYCESADEGILRGLRVESGDVNSEFCGVSEATRAEWSGRIREFWHFAANLTFDDRFAADVDRDNRQGTEHALDLALALGVERFVFCSTAFVAGLRTGVIPEEMTVDDGTRFSNAYERSKHAAEWAVARRCRERGIDFRIVRPSIVVGPYGTKQSGGSETGMYEVVREVHRLRDQLRPLERTIHFDGRADTPLNIMPVDWLVRDFLWLRDNDYGGRTVNHLCAARCPTVQDAFDIMAQLMELPPISVGPRPPTRRAPVERLLNRRVEYYNSYVTYSKEFARGIESKADVTIDDLRGFIARYVRELEGEVRERVFHGTRTASFDGYMLDVHEAGRRDGEPVIFVNSYGMPVDFWLPLASTLADDCGILTWESRGVPSVHGPAELSSLAPANHVRDLATLMKARGYDKAHLVAWCTGCEIALAFARSRPECVSSLVLMNGAYSAGLRTSFQDTLCSVAQKMATDERYAEFYYRVIYGNSGGDVADATRKMDALLREVDPALLYMAGVPFRTPLNLFRYALLVESFFKQPVAFEPESLDCPTLVISSTNDHLTRYENSVSLESRFRDSALDLMQGGDHYRMYYDRKLMDRIRRFILAKEQSVERVRERSSGVRAMSSQSNEEA